MSDALTGRVWLTTKASTEMLIWQWFATLTETIKEYNLSVDIALVKSAVNWTDALTRVLQHWLTAAWKESEPLQLPCTASELSMDLKQIMSIHEQCGHPRIKRMLYFLKMVNPAVKKADVRMVVQRCQVCQSINPATVQRQKGNLSATHVWNRLGIDVKHVGSQLYLTVIDYGPSRFAIWWLQHWQDTTTIICQMESIFYNGGPPVKILTDNGATFSSEEFSQFLRKWGVWIRFQCAYVPAGNGIVERSHQSIKVIAARKQCWIPEAVYWYNVMLKDGVSPTTAPANMGHTYHLELWGINITVAPCNAQGKYRI